MLEKHAVSSGCGDRGVSKELSLDQDLKDGEHALDESLKNELRIVRDGMTKGRRLLPAMGSTFRLTLLLFAITMTGGCMSAYYPAPTSKLEASDTLKFFSPMENRILNTGPSPIMVTIMDQEGNESVSFELAPSDEYLFVPTEATSGYSLTNPSNSDVEIEIYGNWHGEWRRM